ncbi:MAG: hypothetical protein IKV53_07240 [Clostridia bacterium]|nr:hypothetical protein [Clostridia bacterium]
MSIESFKIKDEDIKTHGVQSVGDKLTGSAAQNKAVFDRLIKDYVRTQFNALIDKLVSDLGASSIGMTDLFGENNKLSVFTATEKLKNHIESFYTPNEVSESHIKNVTFDEKTGVFSFERENGEVITLDTGLEKIAVNFEYDSQNEKLILELVDGTKQEIPLTALISFTDFVEGNTVKFSNLGNNSVKAEVKDESITNAHLSSELKSDLIEKVADASNSAEEAKQSKEDAVAAKNDAEDYAKKASASALDASNAASLAEDEKQAASNSASSALSSKQAAEKAQQDAEKAAEESKKARDRAVEIADFDPSNYVKNTDYAEIYDKNKGTGKAGIVRLSSATYGLYYKGIDGVDRLAIHGAKESHIDVDNDKRSAYMPITPSILDYAVKVGLTANKYTLTDEEKNTIANWLGSCRIATGTYEGAGGIEGIVQFALGFSPDIVFLICPETEDNDFASFAIFFRHLSEKGTYWNFANDIISKKRASDLEFANTFSANLGDNIDYSMQLKTYYYIAIGKGE